MFNFYGLRKFGRFIIREIKWIPILWKQEDWDYEYIYELMEVKMKELRECLRQDDMHVDSDKYARQISICLAYMDRFRNWDHYVKDYNENRYASLSVQIRSKKDLYKRKASVRRMIAFETDNFNMFWKRFVQWHKQWWC